MFFFIFILYTISEVPISPLVLAHLQPAPLPPGHPHTVVSVHGLCIYVLRLIPPPCFIQHPQNLPLISVSLFPVSLPLFLFCSSVYFVHQIPHMSEIVWYLSFANWLISLSILFSRSIHAVMKGENSFLLTASSIILLKHFDELILCNMCIFFKKKSVSIM